MKHVLASALGSRKSRFELRPIADAGTLADWIAAGADPKKPPKGLEARRFHDKARENEEKEWTLVEAVCMTEKDIANAEAQVDMNPAREGVSKWLVRFELKPDAAKNFDKSAAELFARTPKGRLAIILDERILTAPTVQTDRFDGNGHIEGNFTKDEAKGIALALKGEWLESLMRAEKMKDAAAPEKMTEFLRGIKGLEKVAIQPDASGLDLAGYLDTKGVDLVSLWQSLRERGYKLAARK